MDDRRGNGFGQRRTGGGSPKGKTADGWPDRLPLPRGTAQLYERLRQDRAVAHPVYALSKMVTWYEGWAREADKSVKRAPSVNAHAFGKAATDLNAPSLRELAERVRARREAWLATLEQAGRARRLTLTARTDVVIWLVSPGPLELGLALHHVYGFPILPASSLKGVALRASRRRDERAGANPTYGSQDCVAQVAILDGLPCREWTVQRDVMTPHFPKWYGGEAVNPDDTESPRPIPFLSIAAGSSFEVAALATTSGNAGVLGAVENDLRLGLEEMGLGAKTAAGYGVFGVEVPPPLSKTSISTPSRQSAVEPMPGPSEPPQATSIPPKPEVSTPQRDLRVADAETMIRGLRFHEVKSQLQAVAAAIRKCPDEEREGLVELFRKRQGELGLKAKEVRPVMEALAQRLGPAKDREP